MLLKALGIDNAEDILGLRPGEALKCIHSHEMPGGCGTSEYCSTCGAAISMITSMTTGIPTEKVCAISTVEGDKIKDLFLRVKCVPVTYDTNQLLLLFIQDITYQQNLAVSERLFFHDISGITSALISASDLIQIKPHKDVPDLLKVIKKLSWRLADEISIQKCLINNDASFYKLSYSVVTINDILQEIRDMFSYNPVSKNKSLLITYTHELVINTEPSLLTRILENMITNAFEETTEGDHVRLWVEQSEDRSDFYVWNRKFIPDDVAKRIFQRNFSTKAETGRGLGTYSAKFFGENILGGIVGFTTSEKEGTVFHISLKNT